MINIRSCKLQTTTQEKQHYHQQLLIINLQHYFCDRSYPAGDYPPTVDILVLLLTATLFLVTLVFTVQEIVRISTTVSSSTTSAAGEGRRHRVIRYNCGGSGSRRSRRRYWIPSGPIALPFIILSLAKGYRINTVLPLAECIGPALFQLLQISALAFPNDDDDDDNMEGNFNNLKYDIKYILFELSTVSGIFHASLFLDYIILPYYTGLDALMSSTSFSGECASCVCRNEVLVVGGKLVSYRGWSMSMFSVVGVLCLRTVSRLLLILLSHYDNEVHMATVLTVVKLLQVIIKPVLETMSWILISIDCIYLMMNSPKSDGSTPLRVATYGCACFLICLHVLTKLQSRRKYGCAMPS